MVIVAADELLSTNLLSWFRNKLEMLLNAGELWNDDDHVPQVARNQFEPLRWAPIFVHACRLS
jgi:hypothetical protein